MNQELLDRNSGAKTSDWIGQAIGGVIFAYDLGDIISENKGEIAYTKEDLEQALKRPSLRPKTSGLSSRR
jgi:hypothetical protein